jgi:hypothetical protein
MFRAMIRMIALFCCLPSAAQDDWILKKNKDDVIIYTRESADNPLKEYRASARIDHPLEDIFRFSADLEYRPEWVINCTGLEVIDTVEERILYHTSYDIPWPLADRDLVVEVAMSFNKQAGKAHLLTVQSDIDYPLEKGIVRLPVYREDVHMEELDSGSTLLVAEGFVDPGGTVPAWIVNMFLVNGIYDSFIRTREELEKRNNLDTRPE